MKIRRAGLLLLAIQLILVLSVAAKFLYERKTCPRVWTRAIQYDPSLPIRGRYFAMQPLVNACSLRHDTTQYSKPYKVPMTGQTVPGSWTWDITLTADHGTLVPRAEDRPRNREDLHRITLREDQPCDRVAVREELLYFVPEHAQNLFPMKPGKELWVEVTVPPSGPPRPIQLALSDSTGFKPVKFE